MPVDVKLLEQTPAFHALQPQQRDMLAKLLHYRQFPVGKTICEQGHRGDTMYFIEKGEIVFYTHDAAGAEKVFRTLKAGDYFGEVAVFGRGIRSVNARARSEVFALELHRENVDAFVRACPEMALTMLKAMAHRMDT